MYMHAHTYIRVHKAFSQIVCQVMLKVVDKFILKLWIERDDLLQTTQLYTLQVTVRQRLDITARLDDDISVAKVTAKQVTLT